MEQHTALIMLIEDDSQIRRLLRQALEAAGFAVAEAARGRNGIDQAEASRPELVVLDLGLPDMDGVEVVRSLRRWSDMPVIILSARSDELQKVAALDAGADDYLTKPFGHAELLARVRAHLRRRGGTAADPARQQAGFGQVTVDFASRQVSRDGAELHLTPTEFKLLGVLIHNAGKVLTHTYLLRAVWGDGYAARSHYLRIYMARLRQKLELDAARPVHIVTESGVGYRLVL